MIHDTENVARAIFSPRMIIEGEIQPEAFRLRAAIQRELIDIAQKGLYTL
mgnify:CR=1 FL=1